MNTDLNVPRTDLDLWAEEFEAEELSDMISASTVATFLTFGSASCPYSTASSASSVGSA